MKFIQELFSGQAATAICWTLIHSIWEGLFFALLTGLTLIATKKLHPSTRYRILSIHFLLFIIAIIGTFIYQWNYVGQTIDSHERIILTNLASTPGQVPAIYQTQNSNLLNTIADFLSDHTSTLLAVWFMIFLVKSIKVVSSLAYLHHLRTHRSYEADQYWKDKITGLAKRLGIKRKVLLLESELIKIPAVFGHLKPVIFIPLGILANLPPEQAEAILLHELAHIRRRDYLFNLVQNIAETVFFFNPALLWLSSLIREEREHCCDDIAIAETNDRKQFIKALIRFREIYSGDNLNYVTAFPGTRHSFVNRITRIAMKKNKSLQPAENIFLAVSLVVIGTLIMAFCRPKETATAKLSEGQNAAVKVLPASPAVNAVVEKMTTPSAADTVPKNKKEQVDISHYSVIYSDIDKSAGRETVVLKSEGNEYKLVKLNGEIAYLVVNDEKIPKERLGDYSELLKKINAQLERMRKEQEIRDEEQKVRNKEQEQRNAEQAIRNKEQEQRNAEQAVRDKEQEQRNAEQKIRNNEQHKRDSLQTIMNKEQEQRNGEQAIRNKEQEQRNAEQAIRNKEQEQRNAEQVVRNKEQEQRNAEQAIRNKEQEVRNEQMRKLTDDLVTDGIIKDRKDLRSMSFMDDELIINGVKQPAEILKKYKSKYPKIIGSRMNYRYD
jgi:beta-lactamase regulating signal transducer with metallopeptidase domain